MLFRNYHPTLIGLLVCSRICVATTVVAIVSPQGIIVASNSGATKHTETFVPLGKESAIKFFTIQKHLIVAELGTSNFSSVEDGKRYDYHFIEWMTKLQESLPPDVAPDAAADKIAAEAAVTFAPFDQELRSGRMKQGNLQEKFKVLVEYVILGYSKGEPRIYVVQLYLDWDGNKVLEPKSFLLHPGPGVSGRGYAFYGFGITGALDDISNTSSYARRQVARQCPDFEVLSKGNDISLDSLTNIARAEVRVQEKTNPSRVFGNIATVVLRPDGSISPLKIAPPTDKVLCQPVATKNKSSHQQQAAH